MQRMEMEEILHQLISGLAHDLHIGFQPSKVAQDYWKSTGWLNIHGKGIYHPRFLDMSKISYNLKHFIFEEFDGSCGDLTNKTGSLMGHKGI